MRRRLALALAFGTLVVLTALVGAPGAAATPPDAAGAFIDDDGIVHEPNINAIEADGITKGCNPPANDRYCPGKGLTRAELATLFVRAFDLPTAPPFGFQDTGSSVHAANIDALASSGITQGCNPPANDRFCPQQVTTRAQMATFLVRALGLPPSANQPFIDVAQSVHRDSIAALAASGITQGCNPPANDRFCPTNAVSRAQMATFLTRALSELSPIFNQLSLVDHLFCEKDGISCRRSFAGDAGMIWEVTAGLYNAQPFLAGEQSDFNASDTRLELEFNGSAIGISELAQSQSGGVVRRLFMGVFPPLRSGANTIVVRWRWDGSVVRTVTFTVLGN